MANILYTIIISPLVQIIEFVYVFFYKVSKNIPFSVLGVSLTVSFLSLPLYIMAERWQVVERETVKRLKPAVNRIKSVFSGDEQFMILSTYYRQNHYHPLYQLRSSIGLIVQIPFFIAAYLFLSNLATLHGVSFLSIKDIGAPDSLFHIGKISINILPIAMTLINCAAGAVYTQNLSVRDKIQVYGIAALFLILLYNSPSALVLYWTLNNIFSLIKNIFYKIKNPLKVLYIIMSAVFSLFILYILFIARKRQFSYRLLIVFVISLFYFMPLFLKFFNYLYKNFLLKLFQNRKNMIIFFLLSCFTLFLLAGLYIPSSVIASSPDEFCYIENHASPFTYIIHSNLFFFGTFILWPVSIFFLFSDKIKSFLVFIFVSLAVICAVYTVAFSGNYGTINNIFTFNTTGVFKTSFIQAFLSVITVFFILSALFFLIGKNKITYLNSFLSVLIISLTVISIFNIAKIKKAYALLGVKMANAPEKTSLEPVFKLSKENKNVIVIMADGAINGFVPLIFGEHPEIEKQFDGFTLYRNTVSFSNHTLMGVPPLWGGYEYTPAEMNRKSNIPLVEKHNQALLTIPLLLTKAGFNVTVTDPSWANYSWVPDISIYKKYENINAFNTIWQYTGLWYEKNEPDEKEYTYKRIMRNIIWFSILKMNNPLLRLIIYDKAWYWSTDDHGSSIINFIHSYAILDFLPELTSFDSAEQSALFITNETTHEPIYLHEQTFKPSKISSSIGNSKYKANRKYHSNTALYLKLGEWFDLLRKNGVYDNTRIIITADHGGTIENLLSNEPLFIKGEIRESYNPVFLYKDFNSHGTLSINNNFMTNADVPFFTLNGLMENPVNPFTGNPITTQPKENGIFITTYDAPMAGNHGKYVFNIKEDQWMYLHDSIYEASNWEKVKLP
ncbi:MAG: YidC/Oxa1 family membrane protein insertase [Treponema sp.]|jgi:membrane protein insertase Oxa1/YidC/SpoIIIJ|nr:YidC/Oxa1 family membrane protein insertase [Treponema sp.]